MRLSRAVPKPSLGREDQQVVGDEILLAFIGTPAYLLSESIGDVATEKLELLILKILDLRPLHGYGIGQRIEQTSGGVFRVTLGALYPALRRLEKARLVVSRWSQTENNRRARYYRITVAGRRRLAREQREWKRVTAAMLRVLKATQTRGVGREAGRTGVRW